MSIANRSASSYAVQVGIPDSDFVDSAFSNAVSTVSFSEGDLDGDEWVRLVIEQGEIQKPKGRISLTALPKQLKCFKRYSSEESTLLFIIDIFIF